MANCKFCGKPTIAANVCHPACWETAASRVAEDFCDNYCRFPRMDLDEEALVELHCSNCALIKLLNLGL